MTTLTSPTVWPRVEAVRQWLRERRRQGRDLAFLERATGEEMQLLRAHVRRSREDLRWLAGRDPECAELLCHMTEAIGLDLQRIRADMLRRLRRGCANCGAKLRCADELARHRAGERFREYCPNYQDLRALQRQA